MSITAEFMLSVMVALSAAGGAYAAIRVDLAKLHERTAEHSRELALLRAKVFK